MKVATIFTLASAVASASCFHRTTHIAGVEVIDTPIVRDVQKTIRQFPDFLYSHQMRSWLFGAAMINANATLRRSVDLEVHAVATMLHDLGWDQTPGSRWVSTDKRFEVDGAIGARTWLAEHPIGRFWSKDRVRKVYQAIALHGSGTIADFFELDEATIVDSIGLDYRGPGKGVTPEVYNRVAKEFPQDELLSGTNQTFTWFAQTKPATTYDTWLQPWGDNYVPGYSAVGYRSFDMVTGGSK
ncbi:hypothetical protein GGS20DRAFT_409951 [Poronia punctata]|nr:hypothetical protein GGS20DRAFT_409951 [Poronia punctata]